MKKRKIIQTLLVFSFALLFIYVVLYAVGATDRIAEALSFGASKSKMERMDFAEEDLFSFSIDDPDMQQKSIEINDALFLINADYPVLEDRVFAIEEYKNSGVLMNRAMISDYAELSAAVTDKTNDKLFVMSSFRSFEKQRELYEEDPKTAAAPGLSEHHSALALDVYVHMYAGHGFLNSEAGKFVNAHCPDYGFIIRYPRGKEQITGFAYEPWHIRYVGTPHARFIAENKITLEEYIDMLIVDEFYQYEDWVISRQKAPTLRAPKEAVEITVSEDNTGYVIITAKMK